MQIVDPSFRWDDKGRRQAMGK